jgi:hypothetical protein
MLADGSKAPIKRTDVTGISLTVGTCAIIGVILFCRITWNSRRNWQGTTPTTAPAVVPLGNSNEGVLVLLTEH